MTRLLTILISSCALLGCRDKSAARKTDKTALPVVVANPNGNGVDDLKKSCEIRATWKNRLARKCNDCISSAPSPSCGCEEFRETAGRCYVQDTAKNHEPACTAALDKCAHSCAATDCTCYGNCYATSEACRAKAAAREGCVTEVCGRYCE